MAVAAYGSLVSLLNVLDGVHHRAQLRLVQVDMQRIETVQEAVDDLVEFLELHSQTEADGIEGLWRQISEVAFQTEWIFDSHVVRQLELRSIGDKRYPSFSFFCKDLDRVIQKFDFIKKEISAVKKVEKVVKCSSRIFAPTSSLFTAFFDGKNIVVGLEEQVHEIMEQLMNDKLDLQIIPIIGMGGIGKTTLARTIYAMPHIVDRFDICIWLTISQEYNMHEILIGLQNEGKVDENAKNNDELGESLHKKLFGRRYLIVMDDVWSEQVWNDLRKFFPNNQNGSRVMVTTRLSNVASSFGSHNPYSMSFLDKDKSWKLFCQSIFAQESCPYPELEDIGKDIVRSCRGLPLEIVVIGGHLANSSITKEYWELVADNMKSFGNVKDSEHCMKVLYLSYNNLPIHLKLCFLYLRNYPEDGLTLVRELIQQLIAEGFVKPIKGKCLEEIANEYIKDLFARSLIISLSKGEIDVLKIHDLLRDLCLRESEKEKFICSLKVHRLGYWAYDRTRKPPASIVITPRAIQVKPLVCKACEMRYSNLARPRLAKVAHLNFRGSHRELMLPSHSRFVEWYYGPNLLSPLALHRLWNLQTIYIGIPGGGGGQCQKVLLPPEFWEMTELRLLYISGNCVAFLSDPIYTDVLEKDVVILKNLQSLETIGNFKGTKKILDRIPNLKTLRIRYGSSFERLGISSPNLSQLERLEELSVQDAVLKGVIFPNSLKHLHLRGCKIPWKDMTIIGSLPHLEVLWLEAFFGGLEWVAVEGEFLELKELFISCSTLKSWKANAIHFPKLERLQLIALSKLEEIPSGIGDIATLQTIKVTGSESAINSAKNIWEEQQDMGNESLQIQVYENGREYWLGASNSQ